MPKANTQTLPSSLMGGGKVDWSDPEQVKAYNRKKSLASYYRNYEANKAKAVKRMRQRRATPEGRAKDNEAGRLSMRRSYLRRHSTPKGKEYYRLANAACYHRISPADVAAFFAEHGNVCQLTGAAPNGKRLSIDHDHKHCKLCSTEARSCGESLRGPLSDWANRNLGVVEKVGVAKVEAFLLRPHSPFVYQQRGWATAHPQEAKAMWLAQGKACAVCGEKARLKDLVVDHSYESKMVRGLVHHGCNTAVGFAEQVGLGKIKAYLARPYWVPPSKRPKPSGPHSHACPYCKATFECEGRHCAGMPKADCPSCEAKLRLLDPEDEA